MRALPLHQRSREGGGSPQKEGKMSRRGRLEAQLARAKRNGEKKRIQKLLGEVSGRARCCGWGAGFREAVRKSGPVRPLPRRKAGCGVCVTASDRLFLLQPPFLFLRHCVASTRFFSSREVLVRDVSVSSASPLRAGYGQRHFQLAFPLARPVASGTSNMASEVT